MLRRGQPNRNTNRALNSHDGTNGNRNCFSFREFRCFYSKDSMKTTIVGNILSVSEENIKLFDQLVFYFENNFSFEKFNNKT